jgi:hypothetical protein
VNLLGHRGASTIDEVMTAVMTPGKADVVAKDWRPSLSRIPRRCMPWWRHILLGVCCCQLRRVMVDPR